MAGMGSRFRDAGYAFPKPLIDIGGKTMIEVVTNNIKPKGDYKFIFICQREHYEKYDLYNILKNCTGNKFDIVCIDGITQGAACTVLTAIEHINNGNELIIANSDQFIDMDINDFIAKARSGGDKDGLIMTFESTHPKWSYARMNAGGQVVETAEKRVISNAATVGLYYFRHGSDFVEAAQSMILKNIRHNNEFYVCPVYNELILNGKKIYTYPILSNQMHGLGTPEDLDLFLQKLKSGEIKV